jgi:hypothetical protein
MAVGAILPPLFFAALRATCSENGIFRKIRKRNRAGRRIQSPNSMADVNQPGHP